MTKLSISIAACAALLALSTLGAGATSKLLYGTILANNGAHHSWYAEGYVSSYTGCDSSTKTGPSHTSAVIGEMWMRSGRLYAKLGLGGFDAPKYSGVLKRDGSFQLSGKDASYPTLTVHASGRIRGAAVSGTWDAPYLSNCMLHYTITRSHLDPGM
jgi:hypothetical protein